MTPDEVTEGPVEAGVESYAADAGSLNAAPRRWRPSWVFLLALAIGAIVTTALALTALAVYNRNERRLLNLRTKEVALILSSTTASVQTPLSSAAELASVTGGSPQRFRELMAPVVGLGRSFTSASLWPLGRARLAPTALVGVPPRLASEPAHAKAFLLHESRPGTLNVTTFLNAKQPALGFDFSVPGPGGGYVVYAENPLPANRRTRLETNTAFSDLNYVLYIGRSQDPKDLLLTSVKSLPVHGNKAVTTAPFGSAALTVVITPNGSLGGAFFKDLPWIIAIVGGIVTLAAATMTDRLAVRRREAEGLARRLDRIAAENRRMYTEQRSIAQTLQHSLLPDALPEMDGLSVGARYIPAASGVDVGGDWYDVVDAGEGCVLLVIGDVSGHGLRAATTMALVRHATLAYASVDAAPGSVLTRLAEFVNRADHDYFATVLCALIDTRGHNVTLASAGHLPPLLLNGTSAGYLAVSADVPIGVPGGSYHEETVPVPPRATLVAFTDGLVERRGEVLDVGLARLKDLATAHALPLEDLLGKLASDLATQDHHDDTAIVGVRWQT